MAASPRGNTGYSCYFITASAFQKQKLLQSDRMARLFLEVLRHYRLQKKYLPHEFVVMPDHFHLLITPTETLERAPAADQRRLLFQSQEGIGLREGNLADELL